MAVIMLEWNVLLDEMYNSMVHCFPLPYAQITAD